MLTILKIKEFAVVCMRHLECNGKRVNITDCLYVKVDLSCEKKFHWQCISSDRWTFEENRRFFRWYESNMSQTAKMKVNEQNEDKCLCYYDDQVGSNGCSDNMW